MWIPLIGFVVSLTTLLSIIAVVRFSRRQRALSVTSSELPSVTVLKPLCGADDALEKNLETFFRQTHPHFELVFGVEGETDPAIAVVRSLRTRYPDVRVRLVIHDGKRALNPKVSNLSAMLAWGSFDVVVISDSNVAVRPDWLSRMASEFASHPDNGLVTNLFVGTGEVSLGATLENLHLAGPVAGSIAVTNEFGEHTAAVGKSMMFRRSTFESLGGFESVGSFLAEDYVMGRMFAEAGYRVRLAAVTVENVCTHTQVSTFLKRHTRWGLLRSRLTPQLYPFEPLINPMFLSVVGLAAAGTGAGAALLYATALTLARDAIQWVSLRGKKGLLAALPLGPIKELAMLGVWAVAPFLGRVAWRGKSYRVAAGTRLYAARPMAAPEKLEWE